MLYLPSPKNRRRSTRGVAVEGRKPFGGGGQGDEHDRPSAAGRCKVESLAPHKGKPRKCPTNCTTASIHATPMHPSFSTFSPASHAAASIRASPIISVAPPPGGGPRAAESLEARVGKLDRILKDQIEAHVTLMEGEARTGPPPPPSSISPGGGGSEPKGRIPPRLILPCRQRVGCCGSPTRTLAPAGGGPAGTFGWPFLIFSAGIGALLLFLWFRYRSLTKRFML